MTVFIGTSGGNKILLDPEVGLSGGKKDIQKIWVGTSAGNKLVYQRISPLVLTATVVSWQQVNLSWTNTGADFYKVYRNGALIKTFPDATVKVYQDTSLALRPSTPYTYRVEGILGGTAEVFDERTVTTANRLDMALTASSPAWDLMDLSWTDANANAGVTYWLYRYRLGNPNWEREMEMGTAKSIRDSGLIPYTDYYYELYAVYNGVIIPPTDTLTVKTAARTAPLLTANYINHVSIAVRWPDADRRTITKYDLYRRPISNWDWVNTDPGGTDEAHDDSGLAPSSTYRYLVRSWRGSQQILPDYEVDGSTRARKSSQKYIELNATSCGSYRGNSVSVAGAWTDKEINGRMFCGLEYGGHRDADQHSGALYDIPANVRGCISVDAVHLSMRVQYVKQPWDVWPVVMMYNTSWGDIWPSSSGRILWPNVTGNDTWLGGGGEYIDITAHANEGLRTGNVTGFGLAPDSNTSTYGYCYGLNVPIPWTPSIRIWWTSWDE